MNFVETDEFKSLWELAPECVQNAFQRLTDKDKGLLELDERELEKEVKLTRLERRLKLSFWKEFDKARQEDRLMRTCNIIDKVCSAVNFRDYFLHNPAKVVWLCHPPKDYMLELETMMDNAADRLREILELKITKINARGQEEVDTAAAGLVLKAIKQLEDRVRGAPTQTQKIDQRSMSLSIASGSTYPQLGNESTERRIKELEDQLKQTRISMVDEVEDADVLEEKSSDTE